VGTRHKAYYRSIIGAEKSTQRFLIALKPDTAGQLSRESQM